MIFFNPNKNFYSSIEKLFSKDANIIEIGAGRGFLAKEMMDRGYKIYPIDLYPNYSNQFTMVYPYDAIDFPYPKVDAVICARPCHNDFVSLSLVASLGRGVKRFIYISKIQNFKIDIPEGLLKIYECNLISSNCGEEGEHLWELKMR